MDQLTQTADGHQTKAIVRCQEFAELARFYDPEVMLAICPAPPSPDALRHARQLAEGDLCTSTLEVSTPGGAPTPGALYRLAAEDREHAGAWVSYLEEAIGLFALLVGAEAVGVRQVISDGPHCPRFHVDRVHARGIINVLGARTEWIDDDVDRSLLGHAGGSDDSSSGLIRDWTRITRIESGTLAVFKGTAWPEAADQVVVHRSPPSDGCRRLLLTLDWVQ